MKRVGDGFHLNRAALVGGHELLRIVYRAVEVHVCRHQFIAQLLRILLVAGVKQIRIAQPAATALAGAIVLPERILAGRPRRYQLDAEFDIWRNAPNFRHHLLHIRHNPVLDVRFDLLVGLHQEQPVDA